MVLVIIWAFVVPQTVQKPPQLTALAAAQPAEPRNEALSLDCQSVLKVVLGPRPFIVTKREDLKSLRVPRYFIVPLSESVGLSQLIALRALQLCGLRILEFLLVYRSWES